MASMEATPFRRANRLSTTDREVTIALDSKQLVLTLDASAGSVGISCISGSALISVGPVSCSIDSLKQVLGGKPLQISANDTSLFLRASGRNVWVMMGTGEQRVDESILVPREDFESALLTLEGPG